MNVLPKAINTCLHTLQVCALNIQQSLSNKLKYISKSKEIDNLERNKKNKLKSVVPIPCRQVKLPF